MSPRAVYERPAKAGTVRAMRSKIGFAEHAEGGAQILEDPPLLPRVPAKGEDLARALDPALRIDEGAVLFEGRDSREDPVGPLGQGRRGVVDDDHGGRAVERAPDGRWIA